MILLQSALISGRGRTGALRKERDQTMKLLMWRHNFSARWLSASDDSKANAVALRASVEGSSPFQRRRGGRCSPPGCPDEFSLIMTENWNDRI
jgi:hypothetical protein